MGRKIIDITGKVFGSLTVLGLSGTGRKTSFWNVRCVCGREWVTEACFIKRHTNKSCGCHPGLIDLTGKTFGRWSVVEQAPTKKGVIRWKVRCSCGSIGEVSSRDLRRGISKSCGCLRAEISGLVHLKDLTGNVFGRLYVIGRSANKGKHAGWLCRCDCGKFKEVSSSDLIQKHTTSCGCFKSELTSIRCAADLVGKLFGRLIVIDRDYSVQDDETYWVCICTCGVKKSIKGYSLTHGDTRSCGCLSRETAKISNTTHGLSKTKDYLNMVSRNRLEKKKNLDVKWTPLMELCLRDYQPACVVCGSTDKLSVDHVLPLSKGNGLYPGNAVTLCKRHNSMKHAKSLDQLPVEMANKIKEAAESFRVAWSGGF